MNKKNLVIVCTGVLCATAITFGIAETVEELQQKYVESQNNIKDSKTQIQQIENEKKTILEQAVALDSQINIIQAEINKLDAKIAEYDAIIQEKNELIKLNTQKREEQKEALKRKLLAMYEMGDSQYFYILLKSEDPFEFLSKYAIIEELSEHDKKIMAEYLQIIEELQNAKKVVEESKKEQEDARAVQAKEKAELDKASATKHAYMSKLESQIDTLEQYIDEENKEAQRVAAQIQALQNGNTTFIGGQFLWPTVSTSVGSPFGMRLHPILNTYKMHTGMDIGGGYGDAIYAANSGKVIYAGVNGGYGNCVMIDHGGGIVTLYGHASSILVSVGDQVVVGDVIAKVGSTGLSTGPHLHFEVRKDGACVDPMGYLK